jgi:hypothetical protein
MAQACWELNDRKKTSNSRGSASLDTEDTENLSATSASTIYHGSVTHDCSGV